MSIFTGISGFNGINNKFGGVQKKDFVDLSYVVDKGSKIKKEADLSISREARKFYKPMDTGFSFKTSSQAISQQVSKSDFSAFLPPKIVEAYEKNS